MAQGDLKRTPINHDAKEQLGLVEGRVQQLEVILRDAVIVQAGGAVDEVRVGSTVEIFGRWPRPNRKNSRLVGSAEANPRQRKISLESPIGSALLGKTIGKNVRVKTPGGVLKFKISRRSLDRLTNRA